MRKMIGTVASLIALSVTALAGLEAQPAHAGPEPGPGLTLFENTFAVPVLYVPEPDGSCLAFPPTADSLVGVGAVQQVTVYTGDNCTGYAHNLGTFRTFKAGVYRSFRAF